MSKDLMSYRDNAYSDPEDANKTGTTVIEQDALAKVGAKLYTWLEYCNDIEQIGNMIQRVEKMGEPQLMEGDKQIREAVEKLNKLDQPMPAQALLVLADVMKKVAQSYQSAKEMKKEAAKFCTNILKQAKFIGKYKPVTKPEIILNQSQSNPELTEGSE